MKIIVYTKDKYELKIVAETIHIAISLRGNNFFLTLVFDRATIWTSVLRSALNVITVVVSKKRENFAPLLTQNSL